MEIDTNNLELREVILRPMFCKLNAHTRSDGSAMVTQGETAVTAAILGPVEVKLHNLQIDKAYVDVLYRSKSGLPSAADKLREKIIMETCENALLTVLYPRTAIVIQIFEMDDGGGLLACAINASCLALINTGISMKCIFAAIHCIIDENEDFHLDPDKEKCDHSIADFTFVFDSINRNTIATYTSGKFTVGQYNDALIQCREASNTIFKFYRDAVKKFNKNL